MAGAPCGSRPTCVAGWSTGSSGSAPPGSTGERSGELEAVLVDGVERLDVYFRLFLSKVIVAGSRRSRSSS